MYDIMQYMEISKQVQDGRKRIATGFFALRDKSGNLICETVSIGQDKQFVKGQQDLEFHPCAEIQNHFAENNIDILSNEFGRSGCVLDNQKVVFHGTEQNQNQSPIMTQTSTIERHLGK